MTRLTVSLLSISWRNTLFFLLLSFLLGALSARGMAPWHNLPFFIVGFVGLIRLITIIEHSLSAFCVGWVFGVGHFSLSFLWVGNAFFVDADRYGWLAPIAVGGLSVLLGLFSGFSIFITHFVCSRLRSTTAGIVFVFATIWGVFEWMRGWIFTGFPWNLIASIWANNDEMMQVSSVFGVYGLGVLTLIICGLPATLFDRGLGLRSFFWVGVILILGCSVWFFGNERLTSGSMASVNGVKLRLVQANIPQKIKWNPKYKLEHVIKQMSLSKAISKSGEPPTHIIWPETAVPFYLSREANLLKLIAKIIPANGMLITGAPRVEIKDKLAPLYWNSIHAVTRDGKIKATYDKIHLVPFGEYVPFKSILKFSKLTDGRVDFTEGSGPRVLHIAGVPTVAPLICYEAIFSGEVQSLEPRPGWILNVTNDAWFGHSAGPHQHLASVRFRALEMGVPLVRSANTGISAVIDPYGRVLQSMELGSDGFIDSLLPERIQKKPLYARAGNSLLFLMFFSFGMVGFILRK